MPQAGAPPAVAKTVAEARARRAAASGPVGLVPTMGFLHDGHLSLIRRARAENSLVAVSIFVNPTQFGRQDDYASYPRDLERDLSLIAGEGVDLVFVPAIEEMYPAGSDTVVVPGHIADRLEGAARPGHFQGVATVVLKLFNIVRPDRAYFGQKDAQQLAVIRKIASDLNVPVEVVGVPTVREPDGLAMSSRNVLLKPEQRAAAVALSRGLESARRLYQAGERDAERLRQAARAVLEAAPEARIDYVSVAGAETLEELDRVEGPALVSTAVWFETVRLIDNVMLGVPEGRRQ